MARVAGVDIPDTKRIKVALTYIYGIGPTLSKKILQATRIDPGARVKDLGPEDLARIRQVIESKYQVEGGLRRAVTQNIRRLIDIRCYRGIRHQKGLPVRGQRTRSNARGKRGKRQTVGGLKRLLAKK